MHTWGQQHWVDWEEASVLEQEPGYWNTRVLEAIEIWKHTNTTNLDCGLLHLDPVSVYVTAISVLITGSPLFQYFIITSYMLHHYQLIRISIYSCGSCAKVIIIDEGPRTETS